MREVKQGQTPTDAAKPSSERKEAGSAGGASVQAKGDGYDAQRASLRPDQHGYDTQRAGLQPVQHEGAAAADPGAVHAAAARGVSGGGGSLPHADQIQASFGQHDVSGVKAHVGGQASEAARSMGASAYATGNSVAFAGQPSLHTAAHEAAHVVQQRAGVSLQGGVGRAGDAYEQHADQVADLVVQGRSAESALDGMAGGGRGGGSVQRTAVQRYDDSETNYSHERQEFGNPREDQEAFGGAVRYTSDRERLRAADAETERLRIQEGSAMLNGAWAARGADWEGQIQALQVNALAVYDTVEAGFAAQAAAYREAWLNMKGVLDAVSQRYQTIAAVVGVCLAVTAGFAGGLASGLMGKIAGRFASLARIQSATATTAISEGFLELMKQGIQAPAGMIQYNSTTPRNGDSFSDPGSFRDNGVAVIRAERADVQNYIAFLVNSRSSLEGTFSPASVLEQFAPEWAQKKAAAASLRAGADTKELEKELWRSWIEANGARIPGIIEQSYGARPSLSVPKEVVEHLEDDLGVSESTMKRWAGVS